jgi:hypothetical protein
MPAANGADGLALERFRDIRTYIHSLGSRCAAATFNLSKIWSKASSGRVRVPHNQSVDANGQFCAPVPKQVHRLTFEK